MPGMSVHKFARTLGVLDHEVRELIKSGTIPAERNKVNTYEVTEIDPEYLPKAADAIALKLQEKIIKMEREKKRLLGIAKAYERKTNEG